MSHSPPPPYCAYVFCSKESLLLNEELKEWEVEQMAGDPYWAQKAKEALAGQEDASETSSIDGRKFWFLEPCMWAPAKVVAKHHLALLACTCLLAIFTSYHFEPNCKYDPSIDYNTLHRVLLWVGLTPLPFVILAVIALEARLPNLLWPIAVVYSMTFTGLIISVTFFFLQSSKLFATGEFMELPHAFSSFLATMMLMLYTQHGCRVMMRARKDMIEEMKPASRKSTLASLYTPYPVVKDPSALPA